jgi:hypothetical protein
MTKTYDLPPKLAAQAIREADAQLRAKHKRGEFDEGDGNHPKFNGGIDYTTGKPAKLFGYEAAEFLAKQYRNGGEA